MIAIHYVYNRTGNVPYFSGKEFGEETISGLDGYI